MDVNIPGNDGYTPLMWASKYGHTDIVVELLKHNKVNVNHQNKNGNTALMWASRIGRINIVVQLLQHDKVDVNHRNEYDGQTVLMLAQQTGTHNIYD